MAGRANSESLSPPWNFSWVVQGRLAAMGFPESPSNIRFLVSQGIKYLITLSPEKVPPIKKFPELIWTEIPIKEFTSPTLDQVQKFINICEYCHQKNMAIGIHCRQGKGRTGTMIACYYVNFYNMNALQAMKVVRSQRPGSIETSDQEETVLMYDHHLRRKK